MADLVTIKMEGEEALLEGRVKNILGANRLLREAIDDIADAVEIEARRHAPEDTGALKAHPVDRGDTRLGLAEPRIFLFAKGGGPGTPAVRGFGAGGQIIGAASSGAESGEIVALSSITVAKEPFYAKYVHDGTGIFGPKRKPYTAKTPGKYMVFYYHKGITRKNFRLLSVKGQRPQPYLIEAYLLIDRTYAPARVNLLRAELAALS